MKKLLVLALIMFVVPLSAHALVYTGSLSISGGGLVGTGNWANNAVISWTVTQEGSNWLYVYNLSREDGSALERPAVSHFTLEISPNVDTQNDFWDFNSSSVEFGSFEGIANAMKLDYGDDGQLEWSFRSNRVPTWGDFYAKGGSPNGQVSGTMWNAGFNDPDPMVGPANDTIGNKILRPDTEYPVVPEPSTMLLMGLGLAAAGVVRRRRQK